MFKNILLAVLTLLLVNTSFAQNQVIAKLKQPPPNKLGIADLWALELNNTSRKDINGYVTGSLSEDKDGTIVEGQSKPFVIKAGRNSYTYKDFSDADIRYSNNKYKEILLRTGGAPEGDYTICVEVFGEEGDLIGIENCIYHSVRQLGNISLLTPADGDEMNDDQPVIFSWTPLPDAKEYSLKVVELIGNQSPESALQQNPPFFAKENIRATQFQYPITERKFQSYKSYAWIVSSNGVLSDIGLFKVKSSSIVTTDELPIKYRITLMYPDGGIAESEVSQLQDDLEQTVNAMKVDDTTPRRISMVNNFPEAKSNRRSEAEVKQLAENLFELVESVTEFPFGDDVIVLVGKESGGDCPPAGCGCENAGAVHSCQCKVWQGWCMCTFCADVCTLSTMEEEDPTLVIGGRIIIPPTITDSIKVKDVILIMTDTKTEKCEPIKKVISSGIHLVAQQRKSRKVESLVVKQSYKSENPKEIKYRFTLMYPDGEISEKSVNNFQSELEEFAKIIVADEGLKAPKKETTPKQTQGATFGERVNAELINFFAQVENAEIGEEILILTGTPTGKTVPCPPKGCGCTDDGGESCSCKHWPGNDNYCLCQLCAIRGGGMEPIDILPPPNNNNGTTIKDILIILKKDTSQVDESFSEIVKLGLNKVSELRKNKIEAVVVKQSYKPEPSKEIKYRFVLMYPENGVRQSNVDSLQNDLEEAFKEIKIEGGMPNRISMNVTVSKQTQQSSFGEKVNADRRQLAENLFNVIESVDFFPFGDDVIILGAKQSGGDCPPAGCGCSTPGSIIYCKCVVYQGTCMCNICPDKVVLTDIETEDPVLQLRTIQTPPVKTDSTLIKDIIIVFTDSKKDEVMGLKAGIKVGLETVDNLRKTKKDKDKPVKVHYDLKENTK